jgi:hypothetical protein
MKLFAPGYPTGEHVPILWYNGTPFDRAWKCGTLSHGSLMRHVIICYACHV